MEREFVDYLSKRLGPHPLLELGIGDDAAVLRMQDAPRCAVTVDLLTDQVDFLLEEADPKRVGRKALAVNLSDLAAMAAEPIAAVVALALPRSGGKRLALELYEGILPLAEQYDMAIAGGDTNSWDGPLAISITAIGRVTEQGPLRRDGARPGDQILVTGSFGGSILGRHFDFPPRVAEAITLASNYRLHAGIDVSDGLSIDLDRLATASQCGAALRLDQIPVSADAVRLSETEGDRKTPVEHALDDGEDFELILAVPPGEAERLLQAQPLDVPVTRIGHFIDAAGLWQEDTTGSRKRLAPGGWQHRFD